MIVFRWNDDWLAARGAAGDLNVGDLFAKSGTPRSRIRRREIAKGGRAGDVFLPDALMSNLVRFWSSGSHGEYRWTISDSDQAGLNTAL